MSQLQITNAGSLYKDQVFAGQEVQNISHFVFANVPGQDETQPIDPNSTVPTAHVVKELPVKAVSALDGNAVVISCVMGYDVGNFDFNWYGAVATKANGDKVLVAIVTTATQTKTKTVGNSVGNYSVKSIVWRSQKIAGQLNVTLSALPWQLQEGAFVSQSDFDAHNHDSRYELKGAVVNTWRSISSSLSGSQHDVSASEAALATAYNAAVAAQQKANSSFQIATVTTVGGSLLQHTKAGIYRIFNATSDLPPTVAAGDNDFIITVKGLDGIPAYETNSQWLTLEAQDVRSPARFTNTRVDGIWLGWTKDIDCIYAGNGTVVTAPNVTRLHVSVWEPRGELILPESMRNSSIVEVSIYNDGAGLDIKTGSFVQHFNGIAQGTNNRVSRKGTLYFESMGNHWRVKGVKSK